MNQAESIILSKKDIALLLSGRGIAVKRPIGQKLVSPGEGAYFDKYHKGPQWNWWTADNKQHCHQIIVSPFVDGAELWVKESFSKMFTRVYPFPKAYYATDFFGRDDVVTDPIHVKGCNGNFGDCFACCEDREGKFKWSGPSKMTRELSRLTVVVDKVEVVIGDKPCWNIHLKLIRRFSY